VLVTPTDAIALLEVLDLRAHLLNDTDTFVAKGHVILAIVKVGTTKSRGGHLEKDLIAFEIGLVGLGLVDLAAFGALEYCEGWHVILDVYRD
jgi:hypothetical protein